jgi:hypothetical protein
MQSSYYDAIADTTAGITALRIGNNILLGDIEIGNSQTTGDIKIGQSDIAGATITIGKSATATTLNGSVTTANLLTATGGISSSGAITTTGNISTTGSGTMTSAGLLTASAGLTVTAGQTLSSNKLDAVTAGDAQTIGGNITTGSITMGGSMTTGDINIGTISTSDVYIGNATNATTGTDKGTCHISKCQFGANGSYFREMRFGAVGATASAGTVTFSPAMISAPIVTASIVTSVTNQVISILITGSTVNGFSYNKIYSGSGGSVGTSGEAFNWIAISV